MGTDTEKGTNEVNHTNTQRKIAYFTVNMFVRLPLKRRFALRRLKLVEEIENLQQNHKNANELKTRRRLSHSSHMEKSTCYIFIFSP